MDIQSIEIIEPDASELHGKKFETRDELFEDVKTFFAAKGYAISIKNSKKDEYITIGCDRGGVYRDRRKNSLVSRKNETSTRLTNCPFKVQGKKKSDGFWTLELRNVSHNHDASKDMCGHPSSRRLTKTEILEVERLSTSEKERVEDYVWALEMFREMVDPTFEPLVVVTDRDQALMKAILIVFPRTTHLLCIWHIQKNIVAKGKSHFVEEEDWGMFLSTWNAVMYAQTETCYEEAWIFLESLYKEKKNVIAYLKETWLPYRQKFVTAWTDTHLHLGNRVSSRAEGAHAKLKGYLQVSTGDFAQVVSKICLAVENEYQEINTTIESERIRVPHKCRVVQFKFLLNHVSHFALGHLYKQYEMVKFGTLKGECSGHFVASMGLPCAHVMKSLKEHSLSLDSIDSQWRIDTISLTSFDSIEEQNDDNGISGLCDKFLDKYHEAPLVEKKEMEKKLTLMVHASNPLLLEPTVQISKGRPHGSVNKRKQPTSSTRRDPSEFEIVEASLNKKNKEDVAHTSENPPESVPESNGVLDFIDGYQGINFCWS